MSATRSRLDAAVGWIAVTVAGLVALSLPVGYFALSYQYQAAALHTEAKINALRVTDVVNANPELWRFQEHVLAEILETPMGPERESKRLLDHRGGLIQQVSRELGAPTLTRTSAIFDSGQVVGKLEVSRSLRPLLLRSAVAGVLGLLLFLLLRVFPVRTLQRALSSLAEEKERAQVTLHSIADGVIATNTELKVISINEAAERLTGWSSDEAAGRPLAEIFRAEQGRGGELVESMAGRVLKTRTIEASRLPSTLVGRDGGRHLISESAAPISDAKGGTIGVVLAFRDITENQRLEEELIKAQRLESIGLLAGGIAHDFNNVLTAILGNISLARLHASHDEAVVGRLVAAEQACERAKSLTNQLLTFSRGGGPVKKVVGIRCVLEASATFALTGSKATGRFVLAPDLWPVEGDEGQIAQVVENLVINASQAMPDGGTITIRATNAVLSDREDVPLPQGRYVKLTFEDRGCGIRAEDLPRIFDPYFTTKKEGTGLGLATTYSIVMRHGGQIAVESTPEVGTTFRVYLPASDRAPASVAAGEELPGAGKGRILVMDDESAIREVSAEILASLGYAVETAKDGEEAIRLYREALAAGRGFDAVILDLTVPGGVGGQATLERLRVFDPEVRAIVSSGYHHDSVVASYKSFGFAAALGKPFKMQDLALTLLQVLRS